MLRWTLLGIGALLMLIHLYFFPVSQSVQYSFFFLGILILGVPHGAADLLVASQQATEHKKTFSTFRFLFNYILRLALFGLLLWLIPVVGFTLFIFFAAYHFGETDLYYFNTKGVFGKLFVISYGLLILGVILLQHFNEVVPLLQLFDAGKENILFIQFIETNRISILSLFALSFFAFTFIYFLLNQAKPEEGKFLIHFAIVLVILFYLPMILGLSFYFIAWHSILSVTNIVGYLRKNNQHTMKKIMGQILLYSSIAIAGIVMVGLSGFMFVSNDTMMVYVILGLAVLTAPHMEIMHEMYHSFRKQKLQHS